MNCAALPDSLIEAEFFGHERGAFTGAITKRAGKFERAYGGTLFLDEIGTLNLTAQAKLLIVLQEKEFERVGGVEVIKTDIRIIAATNKPLENALNEGTFREDLYYKLNIFPIYLPPLRERKTDILLLANFFLERCSKKYNKDIGRISTPAIDMFMCYHWPGNVRELENCIEKKLSLNSYYYPFVKIVNSTWLYNKIKGNLKSEKIENKIYKCINAVDTDIYKIKRHKIFDMNNVVIISYGGRNVAWKGFMDMAEAISITRKRLPEFNIKWNVFGSAILPPENDISKYNSLGFLQPYQLVEAYNDVDILLSASWYESFPLFPIEAMACGLAVVTTQPGTEDYAIQGVTAEVVKERDPESISNGLIKVIKDNDYRNHIKKMGSNISQKFNWNVSIDNFEKILLT